MSARIELGRFLDTEESCELSVDKLMTGRTAIIAKTGYGKSWTLRRIAEQLLDLGYPLGIIDPEGEHVSLAEAYDMLIISPDGDVDLAKEGSPERLAKAAVRGVSFVLDLSKYMTKPEVAAGLVADVIKALMDQKGDGFLVMVDEARELAPERGARSQLGKHASTTETWITALATRGRKRGVGLVFTTQRPQLVSKTVLSQAENKIVLRVEYNADLAAIGKFLGLDKAVIRRIRRLNQGEAYIEGPFVDRAGFIRVGEVKTAHLGSTPQVKPRPPPSLSEVVSYITADLGRLVAAEEAAAEAEKPEAPPAEPREKARVEEKVRKISVGLESAFTMPSERLTSPELRDLLEERNKARKMLELLEESREEMREEVYEFLREEYERTLNEFEAKIAPYRREAKISELVLEAALKDRELKLRFLDGQARGFLYGIRTWRVRRRLEREIRELEERLARVREILSSLE